MGKLYIVDNSTISYYGEYTYTQNIPENKSNLTLAFKVLYKQSSGSGSSIATLKAQIQCGSDFYSKEVSFKDISSVQTLLSKSYTISHNNDGTAPTAGIQFGMLIYGEGWRYSEHIRVNSFLPKINRGAKATTTTTSSNRVAIGTQLTLGIQRDVSSYLVDLYYEVNNTTYNILQNSNATSVNYTFPDALIDNFTNNANVDIKVKCRAVDTNVVSETTIYLKIPDNIKPSLSVSINDTNSVCKNWGIYVKTKSVLEVSLNASGNRGSSITSYSSTIGNYNSSLQSFTTSPLNNTSDNETTTMQLSCNVTDTRGRTTNNTTNLTVYNYNQPTLNDIELIRCNSNGTANNSGTYCKVRFYYKIFSCNNHNAKSVSIKINGVTKTPTLSAYSGTYESANNQLFGPVAIDSSYPVEITLTDSFGNTKITSVLPSSYITRSYKHGGKGIAFGELSTDDGFSCNMNANFKGDLKQGGYKIIDAGSNTDGNYIKYANGTLICDMKIPHTTTTWSAWGSLYYSNEMTRKNFPCTFIEKPTISVTLEGTNGSSNAFLMTKCENNGGEVTTTQTPQYCLLRGTRPSNNANFIIHIIAVGKWR